jgi:sugar phosphate isomerase/epimerase
MKDTFTQKVNNDYDVSWLKGEAQEYHESGFINRYAVDTSKLKMTEPKLYEEGQVNEQNMEYLEKTIDFCKENGIEFVAVTTPIPAATLKTYSDNYEAAWEYFGDFFKEKDVKYYNFNAGYYKAFSHKIENYTDYDGHMNGEAAEEYSKVLATILTKAETQKGD